MGRWGSVVRWCWLMGNESVIFFHAHLAGSQLTCCMLLVGGCRALGSMISFEERLLDYGGDGCDVVQESIVLSFEIAVRHFFLLPVGYRVDQPHPSFQISRPPNHITTKQRARQTGCVAKPTPNDPNTINYPPIRPETPR